MLLLCALIVGSSSVWARVSTMTFTEACGGSGTTKLADGVTDVTWTVTSDAEESTFSASGGIHYGTGSVAVSYLRLSTSDIPGTITKIVVNACGASGTTAKLNVTVGGNSFGTEKSLSVDSKNYTLTGSESGEIVVSLTQASTTKALYVKSIEVTYITNHVTGVTLNKSSLSIVYGGTDSTLEPTVAPYDADDKSISWSSSNENVASVDDNGVVTAHAVGTTTITVTTTDQGKTATCKVTVTPNMSKPVLVSEVFKETFANVSGYLSDGFDNTGWTFTGSVGRYTYGNNNAVKLAIGTAAGSITTPAITGLETTGTLIFKAMGYDNDERTISVSGTNCIVSPESFDNLSNSAFAEKTVDITVTGNNPKITFSAASGMRVYIDDVIITQPKTTVDVKLSATGYASYCSPFALDLTPTEDYTAWIVTGTSGTTVTFEKILGKVAAGTPFIIYNSAKAGDTVELPIIDDDDTGIAAVAGNMLQGTLSPTYVSTVDGDYTNFGLSNGSFLKINNGVMKANKAYLPILTSNLPSGVRLNIVFEEEITGVAEVRSQMEEVRGTVYNLNGQKVEKPSKGMYIMNGKKVIFK